MTAWVWPAAADAVLLLHLAFIVFVAAGGLLVWRWPRAAWVHLPCAAWGAVVELAGWTCPLTPLENHLRQLAGQHGYATSFVSHYLLPVVYPGWWSVRMGIVLGTAVVVLNGAIYGAALWRRRKRR